MIPLFLLAGAELRASFRMMEDLTAYFGEIPSGTTAESVFVYYPTV